MPGVPKSLDKEQQRPSGAVLDAVHRAQLPQAERSRKRKQTRPGHFIRNGGSGQGAGGSTRGSRSPPRHAAPPAVADPGGSPIRSPSTLVGVRAAPEKDVSPGDDDGSAQSRFGAEPPAGRQGCPGVKAERARSRSRSPRRGSPAHRNSSRCRSRSRSPSRRDLRRADGSSDGMRRDWGHPSRADHGLPRGGSPGSWDRGRRTDSDRFELHRDLASPCGKQDLSYGHSPGHRDNGANPGPRRDLASPSHADRGGSGAPSPGGRDLGRREDNPPTGISSGLASPSQPSIHRSTAYRMTRRDPRRRAARAEREAAKARGSDRPGLGSPARVGEDRRSPACAGGSPGDARRSFRAPENGDAGRVSAAAAPDRPRPHSRWGATLTADFDVNPPPAGQDENGRRFKQEDFGVPMPAAAPRETSYLGPPSNNAMVLFSGQGASSGAGVMGSLILGRPSDENWSGHVRLREVPLCAVRVGKVFGGGQEWDVDSGSLLPFHLLYK